VATPLLEPTVGKKPRMKPGRTVITEHSKNAERKRKKNSQTGPNSFRPSREGPPPSERWMVLHGGQHPRVRPLD
jgi:hypothetical protein